MSNNSITIHRPMKREMIFSSMFSHISILQMSVRKISYSSLLTKFLLSIFSHFILHLTKTYLVPRKTLDDSSRIRSAR